MSIQATVNCHSAANLSGDERLRHDSRSRRSASSFLRSRAGTRRLAALGFVSDSIAHFTFAVCDDTSGATRLGQRKIAQAVVPNARRLPFVSVNLASAMPVERPTWIALAAARTTPVSFVMPRMKRTCTSVVV